jgi:hypothetical protein
MNNKKKERIECGKKKKKENHGPKEMKLTRACQLPDLMSCAAVLNKCH